VLVVVLVLDSPQIIWSEDEDEEENETAPGPSRRIGGYGSS
jgi:hypothetical protein